MIWRERLLTLRAATVGLVLGGAMPAQAVEVRTLASGVFEASGATRVPSGDGVLFVDDGRPGEVLWLRLADGNAAAPSVTGVKIGGSLADPEGITTDGTWIYLVGSQSRGGKDGADLVRFRFDPATGAASAFESMRGLPALLERVVPLAAGKKGGKGGNDTKKAAALNIEGLAWDAARKRLLLGLRSPLAGDDALVVPVAIADGPLSASSVTVEAPIRIALGGGGIRSIEQTEAGGFLVVAGGVTDASDFRLLAWDGSGTPRVVTDFPTTLKPEGVARLAVGGKSMTIVVGDSGHYAVFD